MLCNIVEVNDSTILYTQLKKSKGKHHSILRSKTSGFGFENYKNAWRRIKTTKENNPNFWQDKSAFHYPPSDNFLELTHKKNGRQKHIKAGQKVMIERKRDDYSWRGKLVKVDKDTILVLRGAGQNRYTTQVVLSELYFIGSKHALRAFVYHIWHYVHSPYRRYYMDKWEVRSLEY